MSASQCPSKHRACALKSSLIVIATFFRWASAYRGQHGRFGLAPKRSFGHVTVADDKRTAPWERSGNGGNGLSNRYASISPEGTTPGPKEVERGAIISSCL